MSLIKKNFFFTFFNLFLVFTVFGTAFSAIEKAPHKGEGFRKGFNDIFRSLKDTTRFAYILATSLQGLAAFYINLVILQGLGLFPLRLLEFGSVTLYPIYLMGAKTPRGTSSYSWRIAVNADLDIRLCGTCPAPSLQLWLLSSTNYPNLHHLRRIQYLAQFMANSSLRPNILCDW
jgi:hypothetical protein